MKLIRSILFAVFFYLTTSTLCILYIPAILLPRPVFARMVVFWCWCITGIASLFGGMRYRVIGRENIPSGPVIFAAKHQSAWETISLGVILPDVAFVLKKELLRIPLFGWYLGKMQNIAVDRSAGASALKDLVAQAKKLIADNRSVLIFPQGTRMAPGDKTSPYLPGIAAAYTNLEVPVVPVALNSGMFWRRHGFMKNQGVITVEFLPAIQPGLNRREFMKQLADSIEPATEALEIEAAEKYRIPYVPVTEDGPET
ncbi:lysophospholipid acyltransferase family protein [Aestuariispira insulae]|uniref:1-acyl-sn-glycerol-3-phosphate acyltransferase n=1 Tax=Aestuariispira insulae TaxID=1461337 RepID=A0A3D9H6E2_9PROT|nr:lysophospholipid acyltransferase family protein [Aestuariispira insulae]RED45054.1 1-acyl-sn-glycerol-3-phosphate acyltransferase [Aestuariispira insulae]